MNRLDVSQPTTAPPFPVARPPSVGKARRGRRAVRVRAGCRTERNYRTTSTAGHTESCRWAEPQPFYNRLTTLPNEDEVRRVGTQIGETMSLLRSRAVLAAGMSASLLAGLAVAESSGATTPDTTLPGTGEGPVGVIAIGHSGLTGENSDPDRPFQRALENSWATGTNPEVNSVYLRLIEVRPETEGHVANTADGGAVAAKLASQASRAGHRADTRTRHHPDDRQRHRLRGPSRSRP